MVFNQDIHTDGRCWSCLEGSESEVKEDFNVVQVGVRRRRHVDKHHIVDSKERDEEEGGLSQTSAHTHARARLK